MRPQSNMMVLISQAYPIPGNTENYAYLEQCWSVAGSQYPLYDLHPRVPSPICFLDGPRLLRL